jgi:hypothetical protein
MLQFYETINNIIIKHNITFKNTINVLCDDTNIYNNLSTKYDVKNFDKNNCPTTKCLTIIYINEIFENDIINCINILIQNKIKICLIVKLHFDFNKLVKMINTYDIDAISWTENDKKFDYYLIII